MSFSTRTKILTQEGKEVSYKIEERKEAIALTEISSIPDSIGDVQYEIHKHAIEISFIENWTLNYKMPYQHVGSVLIDVLFDKSIQEGKKGRIELTAINMAAPMYFKMGFRFIPLTGNIHHLIDDYIRCDSKEKITYAVAIKNHGYFKDLRRNAAKYLRKKPKATTYQETMQHGLYDERNEKLESALRDLPRGEKLDANVCKENSFLGFMYLPPHTIELKKRELYSSDFAEESSTMTSKRSRHSFFPNNEKKPLRSTPLDSLDKIDETPRASKEPRQGLLGRFI